MVHSSTGIREGVPPTKVYQGGIYPGMYTRVQKGRHITHQGASQGAEGGVHYPPGCLSGVCTTVVIPPPCYPEGGVYNGGYSSSLLPWGRYNGEYSSHATL